jgi:predicted alpha/beta superfamily hydrolase
MNRIFFVLLLLSNLAMAQVERKHTLMPNVHIMNEKFDMPQLARQRRIWIYLPPGYETSKKKYPVIYMQDGQNLFDEFTTAFGQEWGLRGNSRLL